MLDMIRRAGRISPNRGVQTFYGKGGIFGARTLGSVTYGVAVPCNRLKIEPVRHVATPMADKGNGIHPLA